MKKTVGERLNALKRRSGMSLTEIARLAGYAGPSGLQRYFRDDYDPDVLDYRLALRLSEVMKGSGEPGIEPYELMSLTDQGAMLEQQGAVAVQPKYEIRGFVSVYMAEPVRWQLANGGNMTSLKSVEIYFSDSVTAFVVPAWLERRDVYAFYQAGDSMSPKFEDGDIIFTEGKRRASRGDCALIIVEDRVDENTVVGIVGEIVKLTEENIVISQLAGDTIHLPTSQVSAIRRVMRPEDLLDANPS